MEVDRLSQDGRYLPQTNGAEGQSKQSSSESYNRA